MGQHARLRPPRYAFALAAATVVLVSILPPAFAGGSAEIGPVTLRIEDKHGSGCSFPVVSICLVNSSTPGARIGDYELDAYQRWEYIGIAADVGIVPQGPRPGGRDELNLTVRGSDLYVPNPILPLLHNLSTQAGRPRDPPAWVAFTENNTTLSYYLPRPTSPASGLERQQYAMAYGQGHGIQYNRTGPFNAPQGPDSDQVPHLIEQVGCDIDDGGLCSTAGDGAAVWRESLPNASVGMEFYDMQASTDPTLLRNNTNHPLERRLGPSGGRTFEGIALASDPLFAWWEESSERPREQRLSNGLSQSDPPSMTVLPPLTGEPTHVAHASSQDAVGKTPVSIHLVALAASMGCIGLLARLYSRYGSKNEALQSEKRQLILSIVASRPGIAWMDLARAAAIASGTLDHHIHFLVRYRAIAIVTIGKRRFLFLPSQDAGASQVDTKRRSAKNEIIQILRHTPEGIPRQELYAALDAHPARTARYSVARLLELKIIVEEVVPRGGTVLKLVDMEAAQQTHRSSRLRDHADVV